MSYNRRNSLFYGGRLGMMYPPTGPSLPPTGAFISDEIGIELVSASTSFGVNTGDTALGVGCWLKFTSQDQDQGFFYAGQGGTRKFEFVYLHGATPAIRFRGKTSTGLDGTYMWYGSDGFGAAEDSGDIKLNEWHHWYFCLHSTANLYVDGQLVQVASSAFAPEVGEYSSMYLYAGCGYNGAVPMAEGGGIAQLRVHSGWTDMASFYTSDKWQYRIGVSDSETELYKAWLLETAGSEYTGGGPAFSATNGAFKALTGPRLYT